MVQPGFSSIGRSGVMFPGSTSRIRKYLRGAENGPQRHLFKALLISFIAHGLAFLILGPSFGVTIKPGVRQQASLLNAVLVGRGPVVEHGAFESAPASVESVVPDKRVGERGLFPSANESAGKSSPESAKSLHQEAQILSVPGMVMTQPDSSFGLGLSRLPQLVSDVTIVYPEAAGAKQGAVTLRITVDEFGANTGMIVLKAEPKGLFEEAAMSAFAGARFKPGEFLGRPVSSDYVVEIDFLPISRDNTSGRGY